MPPLADRLRERRLANLSPVRRAIAVGGDLVPASGEVAAFVEAVAAHRGRALRLLPFDLGPDAPSGLWVKTAESDYVLYDANASAQQRDAIICHELAHMLLQHDPGENGAELGQLVDTPLISADVAARFLPRHGYADDAEADAENVATHLASELAVRAASYALRQDNVSARLR